MSVSRRLMDLLVAAMLVPVVVPLATLVALAVLVIDGRPVLHESERMSAPGRSFRFFKFRTMRPDPGDRGVSGADKAERITRLGALLRRSRLDELPQLWNLIRGDISVVGPRAPLREYVERFPDLYAQVLRMRPGITGLATILYNRHERMLLSRSHTPEETDAIYCRACIPRKARLDLIHQRHRGFCFDLMILIATFVSPMRRRLRRWRAQAAVFRS